MHRPVYFQLFVSVIGSSVLGAVLTLGEVASDHSTETITPLKPSQTTDFLLLRPRENTLAGAADYLSRAYGVPVCVECPSEALDKRVRINLIADASLEEMLADICQQMGEEFAFRVVARPLGARVLVSEVMLTNMTRNADWMKEDGRRFAQTQFRNAPPYPFTQRVREFAITNATISEVETKLYEQGLIRACVRLAGGIGPKRDVSSRPGTNTVTVALHDTTLREILNTTVSQIGNMRWSAWYDAKGPCLNFRWLEVPEALPTPPDLTVPALRLREELQGQ